MAQAGNVVLGCFDELIRMYKAPPAHALTEEFYETDPKRDFARGFAIQTVGPLPIAFAKQMMTAQRRVGMGHAARHDGLQSLGRARACWVKFCRMRTIVCNLAEEKDQFGIPVAKVTFNLHDNDKKLIEFGKNKIMEVMWAAGATEVVQEARYAHLVGAARMGNDPANSVTDRYGRTHDIANLFICDGSVMPTQGSANPGLTIQALAARTGDYLIAQGGRIFNNAKPDMERPQFRHDLSPPATWRHGVPRLK